MIKIYNAAFFLTVFFPFTQASAFGPLTKHIFVDITSQKFLLNNASTNPDNVLIDSTYSNNLVPASPAQRNDLVRDISFLGYTPSDLSTGNGKLMAKSFDDRYRRENRRFPAHSNCKKGTAPFYYFDADSCSHYGPSFEQDTNEGHLLHNEIAAMGTSKEFLAEMYNGYYSPSNLRPKQNLLASIF